MTSHDFYFCKSQSLTIFLCNTEVINGALQNSPLPQGKDEEKKEQNLSRACRMVSAFSFLSVEQSGCLPTPLYVIRT